MHLSQCNVVFYFRLCYSSLIYIDLISYKKMSWTICVGELVDGFSDGHDASQILFHILISLKVL